MNALGHKKFRQIIHSKSDVLTFGKHKDETIESILEFDPSYIIWLADEEIVKVPDEIYNQAEENDFGEYLHRMDWGLDYDDDD